MPYDEIAKKGFSKLVASISHEILSPVSNIAGFTRLLYSDPQLVLDERTRDLLQRVRRNAMRLTHLVEEAGTIAKLSWELETLKIDSLDLVKIIESALKDTGEVVGTGDFGPILNVPAGEFLIKGDSRILRTAIGGLLINLAKDVGTKRIALGVERMRTGVLLTICHTAPTGEGFSFTEVEAEGSGPSAVLILELFKTMGYEAKLFVSPDGARKITVLLT